MSVHEKKERKHAKLNECGKMMDETHPLLFIPPQYRWMCRVKLPPGSFLVMGII
jgi:hypothetical protein